MKILALLASCLCVAAVEPNKPIEAGATTQVRLEALNLALVKTGWGNPQAGKSVAGLPMQMGGRNFEHGLGVHAPSQAIIDLGRQALRFHAVVGVNDTGRKEPGEVRFVVEGDNQEIYQSGWLHGGDTPQTVDVDVSGIKRLKLTVEAGGDINSDHANWADASIRYAGTPPAMIDPDAPYAPATIYPPADKLIPSPGNTTYVVDPATGDDTRSGTAADKAWKSFAKVNALKLAPGDKVVIMPGVHHLTLKPTASGTKDKPVVIQFQSGRHEFRADQAIQLCYFVSNSADVPLKPRPIGILVKNSRHLQLVGGKGSDIWYGDRMTEFINDQSEDITYAGLNFDFVRPTVSEFRVLAAESNNVTLQIAEGSTYSIREGRFAWTGDLGPGWTMVQQADPVAKTCWRMGQWDPFSSATAEDLGGGKLRLSYKNGNFGMVAGRQFQFRNVTRDNTSAVNTRCKNITLRDCNFHCLPGMGIVSQFTENLTYQNVNVVPRPGTLRTCPAWADCFHFSGCRGDILVDSSRFSGTQDDPINVHGTHLRIIEKTSDKQLLLRFMQPQTYGFAAFQAGDKIEFINHQTLRGYATNTVAAIERKSDKDWLLTLEQPAAAFGKDDVIDNVSWYPNLTVRNCTVDTDSCRGFLITTRGKALVENCTFTRTKMAAILVEDDAEGWFESGPIRDLTIRNNKFIGCGIEINPHNGNNDPALPVHENIRIEQNFFDGAGVSARGVKGLIITGNRSPGGSVPIAASASCSEVKVENNAGREK